MHHVRHALALIAAGSLASGCYADWDAPTCATISECPSGYSMCYEGYCLGLTASLVDDSSVAPGDAATDAAIADSGPAPDSGPQPDAVAAPDVAIDTTVNAPDAADATDSGAPDATPTCSALPGDNCCPADLRDLHADSDCRAWDAAVAFDRAAPIAVDVEGGRFVLSISDGAKGRVLVGSLADGASTELLAFGAADPPCPVLMPDGSVILASGTTVSRRSMDGTVIFSEDVLTHKATGCPALRERVGNSPTTLVVAAGPELVGLDPESGTLRWRWTEPTDASLSPPMVRNGVIVTATATALWRIDEGEPVDETPPVPTTAQSIDLPGAWLTPPVALGVQSVVLVTQDGAKARLVKAAFDGYAWEEPEKVALDVQPLPGAELVTWHDGSPLLTRPGGFDLPPYQPMDVQPCGASVVTAPVVLADGTLLVGTSQGAAAVEIGESVKVRWCYDAKAKALLPPVPLPGGDVLIVAKGYVMRVRARTKELATSPWPMPRHDVRNTASEWR